jgi:hypothetical protein
MSSMSVTLILSASSTGGFSSDALSMVLLDESSSFNSAADSADSDIMAGLSELSLFDLEADELLRPVRDLLLVASGDLFRGRGVMSGVSSNVSCKRQLITTIHLDVSKAMHTTSSASDLSLCSLVGVEGSLVSSDMVSPL